MHPYVEMAVSWLFQNARGRDDKAFFTFPAFESCKEPTIPITSPDCGESGGNFANEYIADDEGRFPTLEWTVPEEIADQVKEWLLYSEDPDAPLPTPICHG